MSNITKQTEQTEQVQTEQVQTEQVQTEQVQTEQVQELNLTEYRKEQQSRGGLQVCLDNDFTILAKQVKSKDTFVEFFAIANARGVADALVAAKVLFDYRASGDWKGYAETTKKNFTNFKNFAKKYAGISSSTLANYLKIGALITDDFHSIFKHADGSDFYYTQLLAIASIPEVYTESGELVKVEPVFHVHVNGKPVFDEDGIAVVSTDDDTFDGDVKSIEELNAHYAYVPVVQNLVTKGFIHPKDTPDTIKQIVIAELTLIGLIKPESSAPKDSNESSAPKDSNESSAPEDSNESSAPEDNANKDTETVTLSMPRHYMAALLEVLEPIHFDDKPLEFLLYEIKGKLENLLNVN